MTLRNDYPFNWTKDGVTHKSTIGEFRQQFPQIIDRKQNVVITFDVNHKDYVEKQRLIAVENERIAKVRKAGLKQKLQREKIATIKRDRKAFINYLRAERLKK
jgi:hypothetical protein